MGLVDGICLVYDYSKVITPVQQLFKRGPELLISESDMEQTQTCEKLKLEKQIDVKNNNGKFSGGRKVTGIEFFNNNVAMVTTNDSRVRFINIQTGRVIMKIKGNKNESFHLRASLSPDLNFVICGSEDGDVYLWS